MTVSDPCHLCSGGPRAADSPWADRFMGWAGNRVGFVGHGVGLDLDEFPVLAPRFDAPLEEGHVLAVEPKVFLEGLGGVGAENTYVVTPQGGRDLTPGPEEIRVLPPPAPAGRSPEVDTP